MKNSVLMRSINTLYFRQNNSLILKLTSGQRKINIHHVIDVDCGLVVKLALFGIYDRFTTNV
jgi:hypothetical protein